MPSPDLRLRRLLTFFHSFHSQTTHTPTPSNQWKANVGITGKAGDLLWHGLAPNTRKVYSVGQTTYARFATQHGFNPAFPVQFEALTQFVAATIEEASTETAKKYLSHLRSYHVDCGYSTNIFNDERLKCILRGASRMYGEKPKRERLEITKEILEAMLVHLHVTHDDLNIRAAFCLAFSAFLRISEFTWAKWDNQSFLLHLSRGSVQFVHDGILLHLPASKSDPSRKGVCIPLSKSSQATCPVSTLQLLFQRYPKSNTDP